MFRQGTQNKKIRSYAPDRRLVDFIRDRLQLSKQLKDLAGEKRIPKKLSKEAVRLGTQKNRMLNDILFQAMADITFFFSIVNFYPEIQKIFDDDIKEILGVKRVNPKNTPYGFMFIALVAGMLLNQFKTGKDFRLRLNENLSK